MTPLADQIKDTRVGVAFSSGFFGFFHQTGVLAALIELGIRPARVSGASAGGLVAAMYAAGLEPDEMAEILLGLRRSDFWDLQWPLTHRGVGLLAGQRFRGLLARSLPVHDFASCRIPVSVNAYDIESGRVRQIQQGGLIPAIYATCAVPYLFTPIEIDGRRYWDGGFAEKTPLTPFLEGPKIDTAIVSFLPHRGTPDRDRRHRLVEFVPSPATLFAHTPLEERRERDRVSVRLLREAGQRVLVLAPRRVKLGPSSLDRGREALEQGRRGALDLLQSDDEGALGSTDLS